VRGDDAAGQRDGIDSADRIIGIARGLAAGVSDAFQPLIGAIAVVHRTGWRAALGDVAVGIVAVDRDAQWLGNLHRQAVRRMPFGGDGAGLCGAEPFDPAGLQVAAQVIAVLSDIAVDISTRVDIAVGVAGDSR
jgi:hypothetical protein